MGGTWLIHVAELLFVHFGDLATAHVLVRVAQRRGLVSDYTVLVCAAVGDWRHMQRALAAISRLLAADGDAQARQGSMALTPQERATLAVSPQRARVIITARLHRDHWTQTLPVRLQVASLLAPTGTVELVVNTYFGRYCMQCRASAKHLWLCAGCRRVRFCGRRCQKQAWHTGLHHCG